MSSSCSCDNCACGSGCTCEYSRDVEMANSGALIISGVAPLKMVSEGSVEKSVEGDGCSCCGDNCTCDTCNC